MLRGKIVLILIISVFLGSCATQRRCNIKWPSKNDTVRIETVRDSIVYKDTTIYVKLPGEVITNTVEIPCPQVPGYVPKKVTAETSLAKASAWCEYPVIKLVLIQKDTTIEIRLARAIKEAYYYKSIYERLHITPAPIEVIPKRFKTYRNIVFTLFALAFAFFGYKAYSFFKPKIKL